MNVKNLLFAASAALTVSLQAEVTANNTLCRIEVESAANSVIVAVPLVQVGNGAAIKVTDYILATNLQKGDSILKWNGAAWDGWTKNAKGGWDALTSVSGTKKSSTANPAADSALARGAAICISRSDASKGCYLYGQVADGEVTSKAGAKQWTLLGNPKTTKLNPAETVGFEGVHDGDKIHFVDSADGASPKTYVYNGGMWVSSGRTSGSLAMISVGQGFWYENTGAGDVSITW